MRSDKLARNYHAGLCLAATLHWLGSRANISHAVLAGESSSRAEP